MSGTTESNPERVGWCHRAVTKAAALMFSVVALTVVTGTGRVQAEAPPIKIAHQLERDSGRLVLEFPKPVDYAVERVGADIYIRFSQPIVGDLGPAQRSLTRYVSEMRAAGAGRVLVIRMTGQPRMTHYRRGNIVTIVWLGAGQATPATAEKRPESKPAENKPSDNKAAEAPAKPPEAKPVDPKPAEPKAAEKPAATPKAEEKPAALPKTAEKPATPPKADEKPATPPKAAEAPAAPKTEPSAAKPEKPQSEKAKPETKRADAAPPEKAKPEPKRADAAPPEKAPASGPESVAPPSVGPALAVTSDNAETRIVAVWPEPTAAAVFRHGDSVWMIFARRQAFDLVPLQKRLGPGVERLSRHEHAEATVLVARVRPGTAARVTRERNTWTVALRASAAAPENDLKLGMAHGPNEYVAVALAGADTPVKFTDPDSGATFFVVPSRFVTSAAGDRRFVTFRIHSAAQGAVVEALADGLAVTVDGGSLVIRRSGGLLLSGGQLPGLPVQGQ